MDGEAFRPIDVPNGRRLRKRRRDA